MDRRASSLRVKSRKTQGHRRTDASAATADRRRPILFGLLLIVATLALYWPVHGYPFVNYDDELYVTYNDHVKAGLHWETVKWAFTSFDASNWHPLTWLSHATDYSLFQMNSGGHHDVNLLLHIVNVLLLFYVLWRATGFAGRSFVVAGLFALHPVNVESVVWIAERKNLLSMVFFLLALGAYRWYADKPRIDRYLLVAGLFILGLMSKPQVITLPFVLLLWDYWPLHRMAVSPATERRGPGRALSWLVLEKAPLLVLSVVSAVITIKAQHAAGAMSGINWQPFSVRLENAVIAYARYVGKAFWPSNLALVYPHPGNSIPIWQVAAALLFILAVTVVVVRFRSRGYLLVGWLWFLGTLVPMIGLVQVGVQAIADRYAYLSFIGLFVMVAWGIAEWLEARGIARAWRTALATAVLLALFIVARMQVDYWSDNVALWTHVLDVTSNNWVAENNLAHALLNVDKEEEASGHFQAAVNINSSDADSTLNLGAYEQQHKRFSAALEQYERVVKLTEENPRLSLPIRAQAFRNMGYIYLSQGDHQRARSAFEQAVNLNAKDGEAWIGLGVVEQKFGEPQAAVQAYSKVLEIQPFDLGYVLMARALEQAGRGQEAEAAMQKAAQMSRNIQKAQLVADKLLSQ